MIGDVFVTTFDGRIYLHPGACQYVLAKSRGGGGGRFAVTLQYTACSEVASALPLAPVDAGDARPHKCVCVWGGPRVRSSSSRAFSRSPWRWTKTRAARSR